MKVLIWKMYFFFTFYQNRKHIYFCMFDNQIAQANKTNRLCIERFAFTNRKTFFYKFIYDFRYNMQFKTPFYLGISTKWIKNAKIYQKSHPNKAKAVARKYNQTKQKACAMFFFIVGVTEQQGGNDEGCKLSAHGLHTSLNTKTDNQQLRRARC